MKEKMVCGDLFQLADFVRLATPLARFGKVDRAAKNQKVGSSNPPGRTILFSKKTNSFPILPSSLRAKFIAQPLHRSSRDPPDHQVFPQ
jgi:hypothetical protein